MNFKQIIDFIKKHKFTIIILLLVLWIIFEKLLLNLLYSYNGYFKKKYTITDNYLKDSECKNLLNLIKINKNIENNPLNEGFKYSKGIIIDNFTEETALEEFKDLDCEFLYYLFLKLKKEYTTDYIMNILIIDEHNKKNDMSVDYHLDTTLDLLPDKLFYFERSYLPECVSVVYVDVPETFDGGELVLYDFIPKFKLASIKPEKGRLVEFKGNLIHGIEKMRNVPEGSKRISIVLEQYCTN